MAIGGNTNQNFWRLVLLYVHFHNKRFARGLALIKVQLSQIRNMLPWRCQTICVRQQTTQKSTEGKI